MFGLGFWEIVVIVIVIIIFIKPEEIPVFVRKIGKLKGEIEKSYHILKKSLEKDIKDTIKLKEKDKEKKNDRSY